MFPAVITTWQLPTFLHPSLYKNVTIDYYEAGHMMYLLPSELAKQRRDLAKFLDSAY